MSSGNRRSTFATAAGTSVGSTNDIERSYHATQQALSSSAAAATPLSSLRIARFNTVAPTAPSYSDKYKAYLINKLGLSASQGAALSVGDLEDMWFATSPATP